MAFLCGLLLEGASVDLCFGPMLAVLVHLQLWGSIISVADRGLNRQVLGFVLPRGVFLAGSQVLRRKQFPSIVQIS